MGLGTLLCTLRLDAAHVRAIRRCCSDLGAQRGWGITARILLASTLVLIGMSVVAYGCEGRRIALGAFISGAPDNPEKIEEFTRMVGAPPRIIMWYQSWGDAYGNKFDVAKLNTAASWGAMPMITWEPWGLEPEASSSRAGDSSAPQPEYALTTIIAGEHDAYIRQWARDAAAWNRPFYLRFAHEMNGYWYPWSPGLNGNTSAQYVAAWRHIHDIFQQEGATKVRWVWSPNVADDRSTAFTHVYPGDAYVDWVALDGYNWGTTQPWSSWSEFARIFGPSYDELAAMTNKPIMIAETASTEIGGDKAQWIRQGLLNDVVSRFPRVRAVVWFHEDKETDWRVNSSRRSLAAYSEVAASPLYQGRLP